VDKAAPKTDLFPHRAIGCCPMTGSEIYDCQFCGFQASILIELKGRLAVATHRYIPQVPANFSKYKTHGIHAIIVCKGKVIPVINYKIKNYAMKLYGGVEV
jgi:hypothetical protein